MTALVEMYQTGAAIDDRLRQQLLVDCADHLELFAVSAAAADQIGLMDVAQLFQSSLRQASKQSAVILDDEWRHIALLITAISEYLRSPDLPESISNLLFATRQLPLATALTDSELATLETLFDHAPPPGAASTDVDDPLPANATTANAQALTPQSRELLELISVEFEHVIAELAQQLHVFADSATPEATRQTALMAYLALLDRFVEVFASIGLHGLEHLFAAISRFLQRQTAETTLAVERQFWLAEWPAHVMNYLADPITQADALIAHCQLNHACMLLEASTLAQLSAALRTPQIDTGDEERTPRASIATPSDVSLQLPEEVNPQLLNSLLQELPHQTAEFTRVIGKVVQGKGTLLDVETAQRVAHTLKGAANTVGVAGIANLTHHIEDILLAFSKQKRLPAAPLTVALQDAADVLEMMSEALLGIGAPPQQQALAVLQQILDWANQIDTHGLPQDSPPSNDSDLQQLAEPAPAVSAHTDPSLRVSPQSVDETLRLIGESIIVNAQLQEGLRRTQAQTKAILAQSSLFQQLAFELEQMIDVRGINSILDNASHSAFDALEMDQYNELHTLSRRIVEAATDSRALTQYAEDELKNLEGLLHQQKRHHKDTQDIVMQTRMLPVQNIVPRLQRSVRQACRLTGKEAELIVSGAQTLIDNDILSALADPLMHLLRNAIDHGVETPALREAEGKPRRGRVNLDFTRAGEHIVIRCQDDGAGLDYAAIQRVARDKGLLSAQAEASTDELNRLIFVAGLSTREQTTQVSGRGIGMDAVSTQVAKMKGSLRVESAAGQGLLVEIHLPVTLVTLHGILTLVGDQVVAIANRGVEQILYADAGELSLQGQQYYFSYKDSRFRGYFLEDLLGRPRTEQATGLAKRPALLLNTGDGNKVAVLVEKIFATQDVVIKKLGAFVPTITGVEGATILGDGRVAAVIDLMPILAEFEASDYVPLIERSDLSGIQSGTPRVLIVDDSLSARQSLAEFMQDSGYRVSTARDGIDAIAMLDDIAPDILLVDMEMPRMNGLELTSYVRANQATHTLPIIMITSRATDKHRREADKAGVNAYLTKPYAESEVLDQVAAQLANAFSH
jgi:chemotaxis protein histidine kinase CheA/ActR/RegA family two-component response regulator